MMDNTKDLQLAVLVDADNIPSSYINGIMEEVAKYGTPTFKRIYGDWTRPNLAGWKQVLLEHAFTPIQQYSYTSGKNATDSAMIIDAMDILYTGRVNGFCLVSSDSDFTRLAVRLREAGMKVFGLGEKKTPGAFRAACEKFIYIEILIGAEKAPRSLKGPKGSAKQESIDTADKKLENLLSTSISDLADENGWAFLGELGNLLIKKQPDFDPRNYGYKKLLLLIRSLSHYDVDERETGIRNSRNVYVRIK